VGDTERPLRDHLEELRWRVLICVLTVFIGAGVSLMFFRRLIALLLVPAQEHLSVTGTPVFTDVTELIGVTVKVVLLGGLVLGLPMLLYQGIMFVAPGLTRTERRWVLGLIPGAFVCFLAGIAFAYYVLLPPILNFLLTFGQDIATPMIRIGNYTNVVVTLIFWMGIIFETPLVMFVLAKVGIVTSANFAKGRRFAILAAFILGAVITPTFDPLNQTLVAAPLIVLYEVGVWLSKLAR